MRSRSPRCGSSAGSPLWAAATCAFSRSAFTDLAIAQADAAGRVPVVYVHPYELDRGELAELSRVHRIPLRLRLSQGLGRARMAGKLTAVLRKRRPVLMGVLAAELAMKPLPSA